MLHRFVAPERHLRLCREKMRVPVSRCRLSPPGRDRTVSNRGPARLRQARGLCSRCGKRVRWRTPALLAQWYGPLPRRSVGTSHAFISGRRGNFRLFVLGAGKGVSCGESVSLTGVGRLAVVGGGGPACGTNRCSLLVEALPPQS